MSVYAPPAPITDPVWDCEDGDYEWADDSEAGSSFEDDSGTGFEAGGNYIRVTFWCRGEYLTTIYTYDVLDLWTSDPYVTEIIDEETGEVLFPILT